MIRVYFYELNKEDLTVHWDEYLALLPEWRRESCHRMKFEKGQLQQLAAGLLLRYALKDAAGIDLMTAEVTENEYGKPMLRGMVREETGEEGENGTEGKGAIMGVAETTGGPRNRNIYFNLSHSDDYITVAVADTPVGIDVETKTDPDLKIMNRFYSEEEQDAVRAAKDPQKEFRRLWTRKEAYVKCVGTGIHGEVAEIPSLPEVSGEYRFLTLKEEEEYALSIVIRTDELLTKENVEVCYVKDQRLISFFGLQW